MVEYRYGGKRGRRHVLAEATGHLVVRTKRALPLRALAMSSEAHDAVGSLDLVQRFGDAGVELRSGRPAAVAKARDVLKKEPEIRFAGRVLQERRGRAPVVYTENLFVKFDDDATRRDCEALLKRYKLDVKRELPYARNAWFAGGAEGIGREIFDVALKLLDEDAVELCHPELVREISYNGAFPNQWHLKRTSVNGTNVDAHANVEAAWALSEGEGTVIAVVDDGVDLDHEEFAGAGKIVAPRDVTRGNDNPRPGSLNNHGTACAGVACAGGLVGASGVAPRARLMPIRLASGLGSQAEADAFVWAADRGADVISCSWGPVDGRWWDATDPVHNQVVPIPDSTRLAIDYAVGNGRGGRGCVITWAAGNGNESVDNDGYAKYPKVIAVAACNDQGTRSAYSDMGDAVWCAFPSNHGHPSLTPGIWTTDRTGTAGYNEGRSDQGDAAGNYTNSFGGTSSACPGVAGVAALVIARNPELRWDEVKEILRNGCDRIDEANGGYDGAGHSKLYGYGRLNALKAVELAVPATPRRRVVHTVHQDVAVEDRKTSTISLVVAEQEPVADLRVVVDIEHTFIGDLVVKLRPPQGQAVTLHDKEGRGANNLQRSYDTTGVPDLAALKGAVPAGTWELSVQDTADADTGRIRSFSLELIYGA